ncbi:MAG: sulfite exporter TauE/SafE family protein [Gaiellales bacterium]
MSATAIALAIALGLATGVLSAVLGVGGGILFVPILVALGLGQVDAAATSLLAIIPTVAMGAARHHAGGRVDLRAALAIGIASIVGVEGGVQLATRLDESQLRRAFALLLVVVAAYLVFGARQQRAVP